MYWTPRPFTPSPRKVRRGCRLRYLRKVQGSEAKPDFFSENTQSFFLFRTLFSAVAFNDSYHMDPISILGTSIAVAQCADRVTGLLAKVKIFINAPIEVDVLIKDVASLKALVCDVRDTIEAISTSSAITLEKTELLRTLIEEGSQILLELEKLIEYEFKKLEGRDIHGRFKVHRTAWASKESKVEQLRDKMRNLKSSISVLVGSMVL